MMKSLWKGDEYGNPDDSCLQSLSGRNIRGFMNGARKTTYCGGGVTIKLQTYVQIVDNMFLINKCVAGINSTVLCAVNKGRTCN